jgi:hypothetical protein
VVRARHVSTPLWVRLIVTAVAIGVPAWLLIAHHDRVVNQRRLGVIATEIAGRPVRVHCPGVVGRLLSWDIVEGSVRWDASGRPADHTDLRARTCAELDALAEGRRDGVLACVAAPGTTRTAPCGEAADRLALAVDVVTHESFHLAGFMDEAEAECHALHAMGHAAERLGATPAEGRALARHEWRTNYPRLPERYRSPPCTVTAQ